ncbi:putative methyltransferase DDB_G0268948 [Dysidea avara]|uniref:putative methyltransferase DDB_G0268948 n=1 Tax=Dysidea avara TaxID=196820 RepID=UPI0033256B09
MAYRLYEDESHASLYSKFRPTYPPKVRQVISEFIKKNGGGFQKMVDVACGSGQGTFHMADLFKQVCGIDISQEQVHQALEKSKQLNIKNVEFCVGTAEKLPFADESVDLVTCAEALHWFHETTFYSEVDRILKHGGCLAAYGYGHVEAKHENVQPLIRHFLKDTLKGCWADRIKHIDNCYAELNLPYEKLERYDFYSEEQRRLPDLIGYMRSSAAYRRYSELHPGNIVLDELEQQLHKELGSDIPKEKIMIHIQFPMFVLICQKE